GADPVDGGVARAPGVGRRASALRCSKPAGLRRVACARKPFEVQMEVILREHVDNLGRRGEIVKVADGYARNFLLPRKLALLATDGSRKQIERERGKFEAKEAEERKSAESV